MKIVSIKSWHFFKQDYRQEKAIGLVRDVYNLRALATSDGGESYLRFQNVQPWIDGDKLHVRQGSLDEWHRARGNRSRGAFVSADAFDFMGVPHARVTIELQGVSPHLTDVRVVDVKNDVYYAKRSFFYRFSKKKNTWVKESEAKFRDSYYKASDTLGDYVNEHLNHTGVVSCKRPWKSTSGRFRTGVFISKEEALTGMLLGGSEATGNYYKNILDENGRYVCTNSCCMPEDVREFRKKLAEEQGLETLDYVESKDRYG